MTGPNGCDGQLVNETGINVVALLKAEIGERRCYRVNLDIFPLADDIVARDVTGEARLTRLRDRILVDAEFRAEAELECVRCLNPYRQPVETEFTEQYWQTVDVRTGVEVEPSDMTNEERDEERFEIDNLHELDLREALRQNLVLALPMRPDCGATCEGPTGLLPEDEMGDEDETNPFAALAALLDDEPTGRG
jgi:uncharacterized protein